MPKRIGALAVLVTSMLIGLVAAAPASAANFEPSPGVYFADTSALTITGPGTSINGSNVGGVAVFSFDNVNIQPGVVIEAEGSRPLKIVAAGELSIGGVIEAGGFGPAFDFEETPNEGGPGGGAGGTSTTEAGHGPGGGGVATEFHSGGGGGGFGGAGADGGFDDSFPGAAGKGGSAYGDLNAVLQGGSGGGGASEEGGAAGGGGGGGAVALFGATVKILSGGEVNVDGGNGISGGNGASGGGSGGGILIHGEAVSLAGRLSAAGGDGGAGGCCGDGGGGGGGRIAIQYRTLAEGGSIDVSGGVSGLNSSGCCKLGTGNPSPQATGGNGVITRIQAPVATTTAATAVKSATATLNGVVGPNFNATTYHFEYGATTAYGLRAPAGEAAVGADGALHAVAQPITGLKLNKTYHFRLVATDALGFVTNGADVAFKTKACIVPKLKGKKVRAARKALKKAHCKVGKVKKRFSGKVKQGRVIKQKKGAGKVLPIGTKVGLKVSKGQK
jgi:PASTA domain